MADARPLDDLVVRAIAEWGRPQHVRAVLVRGSAGITGIVPPGGDLDLLVITDSPAGADWFAELRVDGVPVEVFVREEASLDDVNEILRHQSLPFEVVENLHIQDPHGILARAREAVRPRLMDREFLLARAEASLRGAKETLWQARAGRERGHAEEAARQLSVCLWHGAAAAASAAGLKPTTRRCLVVWAQAAESLDAKHEVQLLESIIGPGMDSESRGKLAKQLMPGDDRISAAIEGMVKAGEERWIAFAMLRSALWLPAADRHAAQARSDVLGALAWDAKGIPRRLAAAAELLLDLEEVIRRPDRGGREPALAEGGVVVRDARPADVSQLVALKGAGSEILHLDRLRDASRGGFRYLVLARGDEVIGFGCLVFKRPSYWSDGNDRTRLPQLVDLHVKESERGRGFGSHLIRVMESLACDGGYSKVHLSLDVLNVRAQALYRRLGYRELEGSPRHQSWRFQDSSGQLHAGGAWLIDMVRSPAQRREVPAGVPGGGQSIRPDARTPS